VILKIAPNEVDASKELKSILLIFLKQTGDLKRGSMSSASMKELIANIISLYGYSK